MRKLNIKKLNQWGMHHVIIPVVAFVLLFAIIGTYLLVRPHAAVIQGPLVQLKMTAAGHSVGCLDDSSSSNYVINYNCNSSDDYQIWAVDQMSNGYYEIQNRHSGLCVNDPGAGIGSPGAWVHITMHTCDESTGVSWRNYGGAFLNPYSHITWNGVSTNGCINDPGSAQPVQQLIMYPCNGTGVTTLTQVQVGTSGGGSGGGGAFNPYIVYRMKQWQGLPYVFGGGIHGMSLSTYLADCTHGVYNGTPSFSSACDTDCSGFVSMVMTDILKNGLHNWTVSGSGYMSGGSWTAVSLSSVQPGDIVTKADGTGHVEFVYSGSGSGLYTLGEHHTGTSVGPVLTGTGYWNHAFRWE